MYILDPTAEADLPRVSPAPRLGSLQGLKVGLLSNGKPATAPFFARLEPLLRDAWKTADILQLTKGNYSAPADPELIRELARCHLIVTGVGD